MFVTFPHHLTSKMLLLRRHGRFHRSLRSLSTARGLVTRSADELERLGANVARGRTAGDVILLRGDLGCGKTCFARGFVRAHLQDEKLSVTSPTYLLVNSYESETTPKPIAFHVDLYRLDKVTEQDVTALGLSEAFTNGITLVEWPERLDEASVPEERLEVHISYDGESDTLRHVRFETFGARWANFSME